VPAGATHTRTFTDRDLTAPSTFLDPDLHEFWADVRRNRPVYWHPSEGARPGFWVVARYDDVVDCYRDATRLGSSRGTVLDVLLRGDDSAGNHMLAVSDGERHRELRGVMRGALSTQLMKAAGEQAAQRLDAMVAGLCDVGTFDFAEEVADKVPMGITCGLLGIPRGDEAWLLSRTKYALSSDTETTDWLEALEARNDILMYLTDLACFRRASPGDDVVSSMAVATIRGERLSSDDVALNCYSLILGGDESSRVSAICAVETFAESPEAWEQVRSGAVPVEMTVDEVLRWATPALHFGRTANVPFTLRGMDIAQGDIVTMWNISANFDENQFAEPLRFRPGRSPNRHVSLGSGPHFCLGAWLGRAELNGLVAALTTHVAAIEIDGSRPILSTFLRGADSLRVRFIGR
jgi:cytochrome P450